MYICIYIYIYIYINTYIHTYIHTYISYTIMESGPKRHYCAFGDLYFHDSSIDGPSWNPGAPNSPK